MLSRRDQLNSIRDQCLPPAMTALRRSTAFRSPDRFLGATATLGCSMSVCCQFFGIEYGYMKLRKPLLDCQRGLLGRFIRFVPRLQLPIDRNMERLGEGRLAGFSDRGCGAIDNRRP